MPEYSKEEVGLIVTGLGSGRRPGHRPMSDAEFLKRYDPEQYRHQQLLDVANRLECLINELIQALEALHGTQSPRQDHWKSAPAPSTKVHTGAIDL